MMALPSFLLFLLLSLLAPPSEAQPGLGINYGRIADNIPSPPQVAALLRSINVSRVKIYDADPTVLSAFAGTGIDFVIALGNEYLSTMSDVSSAKQWIQSNLLPYINTTRISSITVGNEVLTGNDTSLSSLLLPAMQSVYSALSQLGLSSQVSITTASSIGILATSFPPSAGAFRQDLGSYIQSILNFHSMVKSPFLINAYPFFAYKGNPTQVPLDYVLFNPNSGQTDSGTNLHYDNMLYAQIDAVYAAIKAMGHTDIEVRISETGWPSKGDADEVGATPQNAAAYNGNLLKRIRRQEGTPGKPGVPIDVYVFALFNEDLKPGPTSERNYGLYYPNGSPVYTIGLQENTTEFVATNNFAAAAPIRFTDLGVLVRLSLIALLLQFWARTL